MIARLDDLVQARFLKAHVLQEETPLIRFEHGDLLFDLGADHDHFGLFGLGDRADLLDIIRIRTQLVFGHVGDIEDGF